MSRKPIRNFDRWLATSEWFQRLVMPVPWPALLAATLGLPQPVSVASRRLTVATPLGSGRRLRIAFAADFHAGPFTVERTWRQAIELLAAAAPDLLLLGGDFVSLHARYADPLIEHLQQVQAPLGRFAVLGNHDYWAGAATMTDRLERGEIAVLHNRSYHLPGPFEQVSLIGLEDHMAGHPDANAAFDGARPIRIVLMHQPSGLLDVGSHPFSLALAGHTHGGQIVAPGGWKPVLPWGPLSRTYPGGWYDLRDGRALLVTRGIGCSNVPFRIKSPPEVHVVDLVDAP